MTGKIINMPRHAPTEKRQSRSWTETREMNRLAAREHMMRLRAQAFARIVADHAARNGDSYIGQEASTFLELLERDR